MGTVIDQENVGLERLRSGAADGAWITVRDLVGSLVIAVLVGGVLDAATAVLPILLRRATSAGAALILLALGGGVWGRDMARLGGVNATRGARRATGLTIAGSIVVAGLVLSAIEPALVARGADAGLPIHRVFTLVFVPAAALVAGAGAFALGRGIRDSTLARELGWRAAVSAGAAFLVVNLLMDWFGWRVGAPNAARRATMVVVLTLGATGAAVVAGAAIGRALTRRTRDGDPQAIRPLTQ